MERTEPIVILEHHTPLKVADIAIGRCWDKQRPDDIVDKQRMYRVGNKFKHSSTLEHITYNFTVKRISRALLQEWSRTRIASHSVKSSRYTLNGMLNTIGSLVLDFELTPNDGLYMNIDYEKVSLLEDVLYFTGDDEVDEVSIVELELLRRQVVSGKSNDIAKYNIPESLLTEASFTINMRSLQNLLSLRTDKSALLEYQIVARALYDALPDNHKFMFKPFVKDYSILSDVNKLSYGNTYIGSDNTTEVRILDIRDIDDVRIVKYEILFTSDVEVCVLDEKNFLKEFKRLK